MSDSFFTASNQVDPQLDGATSIFCSELVEASARRIAKLDGPLEASKRLQRIADICAGAYVLPIDHWKDLGGPLAPKRDPEPETTADPKPGRLMRLYVAMRGNPAVMFWLGFFTHALIIEWMLG